MTVIFTVVAGDQIRQKDLNSKKVCSGKVYVRSMGKAVSNIGSRLLQSLYLEEKTSVSDAS